MRKGNCLYQNKANIPTKMNYQVRCCTSIYSLKLLDKLLDFAEDVSFLALQIDFSRKPESHYKPYTKL